MTSSIRYLTNLVEKTTKLREQPAFVTEETEGLLWQGQDLHRFQEEDKWIRKLSIPYLGLFGLFYVDLRSWYADPTLRYMQWTEVAYLRVACSYQNLEPTW